MNVNKQPKLLYQVLTTSYLVKQYLSRMLATSVSGLKHLPTYGCLCQQLIKNVGRSIQYFAGGNGRTRVLDYGASLGYLGRVASLLLNNLILDQSWIDQGQLE
jgi:hypothetical protein